MRLHKFIIFIGIFTGLSIFYVWGKVELVRIGYEEKKVECQKRLLLDHNGSLMYNVTSLSNPSRLAREIASKDLVVVPPKNFELVRLIETRPSESQLSGRTRGRKKSIFRFFALRAQAEASQVKPR